MIASLIFLLITQMAALKVPGHPTLGDSLDSHQSDNSEHPSLSIPISNFSANLPPTGFTYDVTKGSRYADSRGCFWLVLNAVSDLAKQPFDAFYPGPWVAKYPEDYRLMLVLSGNDERGFKVKGMIWGLLLAIKYMNSNSEFRNYQFNLHWNNDNVGSIIFVRTLCDRLDGNSTSISRPGLHIGFPTIPARKQRLNATLDFKVGWEHAEEPLDFNEVMMTLISGYSDLATHDLSKRVSNDAFETAWPPYGTVFELRSVAPAPLWLTYGVAFEALTLFTNWYFRHRECRSAYIWILMDGRYVGHGVLIGDRLKELADS